MRRQALDVRDELTRNHQFTATEVARLTPSAKGELYADEVVMPVVSRFGFGEGCEHEVGGLPQAEAQRRVH